MLQSDGNIIVTQAKISDTFFSDVNIHLLTSIKKIQGVASASAMILGASPVESLPIVAIYGVTKNRFSNYKLMKNSYPKDAEALVGASIYERLADKNRVSISNKKFKISGVFQSDIGFENGGIVLNIADAQKIFNKSASILLINSNLNVNIDEIINKIKLLDKNIDVKSTQNFVKNYNQFKIIKTSSKVISLVAFVMGLIGIISIMSITINQRRSEFGIKRALGISMRRIIIEIVYEGVLLGVSSFISAYLLSTLVLYFVKHSTQLQGYVNGEISLSLALWILVASLIMVIIGSILPALNAAKTDPIVLIQGNKS
jgi:ABC-type antimicrobial peptide transport system permease subunit